MPTTTPSASRIDVHHHAFPPQLFGGSAATALTANSGWKYTADSPAWTPDASLAFMDALGISTAILSLPNDIESYLPPSSRGGFARKINTFCREVADEHPS